MAYLLRTLLLLMYVGVILTIALAHNWVDIANFSHIHLAIPTFIYVIFIQAFVMFYFIGVSRLCNNVYTALHKEADLEMLFDNPPKDLEPYKKKSIKYSQDTTRFKRQTIPWTMLMLVLGMIGFLLGAAHDTNLVSKTTHSGVIYGFFAAASIGFFRQWYYLGKGHRLLREMKALFEIPDSSM